MYFIFNFISIKILLIYTFTFSKFALVNFRATLKRHFENLSIRISATYMFDVEERVGSNVTISIFLTKNAYLPEVEFSKMQIQPFSI